MAININIPIEDAVTDGSLNPVTSNAVFDALANKVPYTGATNDVDLGVHDLTATQGTFATSGNPDTLTVNHSSGSGKALTITKGGSGEGIYVNKTSGSGNAVTVVGDLEATNIKRTGGTSAQFLKANGSIDSTSYQPTLVSGTNIKTVNGNSLLGSGDLVISGGGGITVGTTAVTSGTVGRLFFQGAGDVVQQSASLFWDNTNARLGVGATPATTVRLDVRAQGALSTDIAFRVRNSADTQNILSVRGNGTLWSNGAGFIQSNTAFGEEALDANTSGFWNTAFGYKALTADTTGVQNTAFGYQAAQSLTTGNQITAIGSGVLENATTSSGNTGIGFWALRVTTAGDNTAVGVSAMQSNVGGTRNLSLGANAMTSNVGGNDNVIGGWYAGGLLTSGSSNVFLGMQSGYFFGAGTNLTASTSTILIGQDTRPLANNQSNQIVIGHNAIGASSLR